MSVNIYHEGDHPSGYMGIRIIVGSKTRGDETVEYWPFCIKGKLQ